MFSQIYRGVSLFVGMVFFSQVLAYPSLEPDPPNVNRGLFTYKVQTKAAYLSFAGFSESLDERRYTPILSDGSRWEMKWDHYLTYLHHIDMHPHRPDFYPIVDKEDRLIITPALSLFPDYKYQIRDLDKGLKWDVNLVAMPEMMRSERFVTMVSWEQNRVFLSDNSFWRISEHDTPEILSWKVGDPVCIGVNRGVSSLFFPHILIHLRRGSYVDSTCIFSQG